MMADRSASTRRIPAFLLSWAHLGFRLLVFAGLALPWIFQGRLAGLSEELQPRKLKGLAPAEAASLREELARIRVVLGWSAGDEE